MTTAPMAVTSDDVEPSILFQAGPSLERIPDDVLHEILSYLPALNDRHVLFSHRVIPPVVPSSALVRTPTLRALSQTSRLLRLRCLAMAWQSVELCGASIPKHYVTFSRAIGRATETAIHVLKKCPHLLPLIQTVSVVLICYHAAEIIPAFAACLVKLPNLATIQVIHAASQVKIAIEDGFEGKRFPSVRSISLPSSAHEIIKCCPNVEQVTCTEGNGTTVVDALVKGNCRHVRILKGIDAPLTRMVFSVLMRNVKCDCPLLIGLVGLLPNLRYIDVPMGGGLTSLASFPLLDTIEILVRYDVEDDQPLRQAAASDVKEASDVLKGNASQANKMVVLTKWNNIWDRRPFDFEADEAYMTREAIYL